MNRSRGLEDRVAELKLEAMLRRIAEIAQADTERWVPIGLVGQELGLPYGEALQIADVLRERGLVRRGGGGRLEPPHGPRVHIEPAGLDFLQRRTITTAA